MHEYRLSGDALRRRRAVRGVTTEALAREAGLSSNYVNLLERGDCAVKVHTLFSLAEVLKINPAKLVVKVEV